MNFDWSKVIEKCERLLDSLTPTGKAVVITTASVATTIVALPSACTSLRKLAYEFPQMAESIKEGLTTLKKGASNLIAEEVYEAQVVDGVATV